MILDKQNMYSDDQAITADAASTNVIDHGAPATPKTTGVIAGRALYRDMGVGVCIPILVQVTESFAENNVGTTSTLTVALQADNDEAFGSPTTIYTSAAFDKTNLVAGMRIPMMAVLPEGLNERYTRLYYNFTADGTGSFTAGKITAGVVAAANSGVEAAAFRS